VMFESGIFGVVPTAFHRTDGIGLVFGVYVKPD
jgi:hypothetical protein